MTPDQIIEVVTAFNNGKKIQSRAHTNLPSDTPYKWLDNPKPQWDFSCNDYRVAPEPRVIYINEYPDSWGTVRNTEKEASSQAEHRCIKKAVKFVEVVED